MNVKKCNKYILAQVITSVLKWLIGSSSPGRVIPNTKKLTLVASPLSTQH